MKRRLLSGLLAVSLGIVVLGGLVLALVWMVLPMQGTRDWLRGELETVSSSALHAPVRIRAVSSLSLFGISLAGVAIGEDEPMVQVEALSVEIGFPDWFPPRLALDVRLVAPEVKLVREAGDRWNVESLGGPSDPNESATPAIPRWLSRVGLDVDRGLVSVEGVTPEKIRLSDLEGSGRLRLGLLRDPLLELDDLSATLGSESQLKAHGTYELEGSEGFHARLRVEPLAVRDLGGGASPLREDALVTGEIEVEGDPEKPRLAVDLSLGDATVRGRARLSSANGADEVLASIDVASLDPTRLFADAPTGTVTATAEVSVVVAADRLRSVEGQLEVTSGRLDDVDIETLSLGATTDDGDVRLKLDAATPGGGLRAALEAQVGIAEPFPVRVAGDLELQDAEALPEELRTYLAGSRLEGKIDARIENPLADAPTGTAQLTLEPGTMRGLPVTGAELLARLAPDLVSLDRLWVGADRTNLEGHAWIELSDGSDPRAIGAKFRGPVSLALFTDAYGVVETDATFWGHADDLGATVRVNSSGPVELAALEGTFSSRIDAEHLGGTGGEATFHLGGVFEPEPPLAKILGRDELATQIESSWRRTPSDGGKGSPLDHVVFDARIGPEAETGARLKAVVDSRGDHVRVDLPEFEVRPVVGPKWALAPPAAIEIEADEVRFEDIHVDVGRGRIEAQGSVAGEAGPRNDLSLRVADLDLSVVCEILVVGDECEGLVGAELQVKGAAKRPDVSIDLDIDELKASGQHYGTLRATARTRGDGLAVAMKLDGGGAGTLDIEGSLPLEAGGRAPSVSMTRPARIDAQISDLQIDVLRVFAGRAVRRLDGKATSHVELRGPLADPKLTGRLDIVDLTVGAAATGATHRHGRVRLAIDPRRFSLEELTLDEGKITAGGEVRLSTGLPQSFELWVALDEALVVARSEAEVTTSGRVELTGPVDAPRLDGALRIDRATIRPTIAPGGAAPEPDASVVVVRRYEAVAPWVSGVPPALGGETERRPVRSEADLRQKAGTPDLYRDLAMRVTVQLGESVVVRRYDANMRLSGEVELEKAPADELRILGGIGGRQGWYIFQGRRFEIRSAKVQFNGEVPLDPPLDVEAQYRAGEYLVRIRITGTAKNPNLNLSSDPPLGQSDILAVILFGKPASQLNDSQGQVLQSQAFALLASYVAPELQRSVLDTLGLTSLTFSMPTGDTAGTIGVGRYFGDDLFVSVARDFGGPSGGTARQLQGLVGSSVTIQYFLSPSVTLQGASSTEGESSMDVIWHRRY